MQFLSLAQCQTSQLPSIKNQGFELWKYKNASIMSLAYMPHYIRHPRLLAGCLISEVILYVMHRQREATQKQKM